MTAVCLESADLILLTRLTPDLDFNDAERQRALLENGSRDFNAVPGSGKTSLLAAKLLLLAHKWPYLKKGICVLSHTNVAREEIIRRLARTEEGVKLQAYPHFIGTIHGFLNQFLALQALRTLGLSVSVIDDDVFAKRALVKLAGKRFFMLRGWLSHQQNGDALVSKLFFKGPDLTVASEAGSLPSAKSDSGRQLISIKEELAAEGIFRHRDTFAFASVALNLCPALLDVIYRRFPMVFVDEMQDTSWEQEDILNRLFDAKSVVQRFGDIDQRIIVEEELGGNSTFPRPGHATIGTSKRFGARIGLAVQSVRLSGMPVRGEAADDISPVLLLYKTEHVGLVVHRFGQLVLERFSEDAIQNQTVRAMCTRKAVDGAIDPGRHLGDYWPAFATTQGIARKGDGDGGDFWRLLGMRPSREQGATLAERASVTRVAILEVLRAAKAPLVEEVRHARMLIRSVIEHAGSALALQHLILDLVLRADLFDTPGVRSTLLDTIHAGISNLLPPGMNVNALKALSMFAPPVIESVSGESPTECSLVQENRELRFSIGTVAAMKGETHLASLVLESYGGKSRKFDVQTALPFIAGIGNNLLKLSPLQKAQIRHVYVAMSRPSHFLCLAANESRVSSDVRDALESRGWVVERT